MLGALAAAALLCAPTSAQGALAIEAGQGPPSSLHPAPTPVQNVVVLIADDMGVETLAAYGEGTDLPYTPTLDGLAAGGVLFRNAWSQPVCSPTRAGIVTGRHGFRTGIGHIVTTTSAALPLAEVTLPELLDQSQSGYRHALFGKWHLGNGSVGGPLSPELAGWGRFNGALFSFEPSPPFTYTSWPRIIQGVANLSTRYATSAHVDAALKWVEQAPEGPWVLFVAFDAPHAPYHAPPAGLYYEDLTQPTLRSQYKAMIEAMDTEIGRLLDGIAQRTPRDPVVIFVADNGTATEVVAPPVPANHAKTTLYEGGLNVPLIVHGLPGAPPGAECDALVHTVDLFATVAELAGVDAGATLGGIALDSISFVGQVEDPAAAFARDHAYAETFQPVGTLPPTARSQAVRGPRYKLIRRPSSEEFYDLLLDPQEQVDLLPELTAAQLAAYQQLNEALASYDAGGSGG